MLSCGCKGPAKKAHQQEHNGTKLTCLPICALHTAGKNDNTHTLNRSISAKRWRREIFLFAILGQAHVAIKTVVPILLLYQALLLGAATSWLQQEKNKKDDEECSPQRHPLGTSFFAAGNTDGSRGHTIQKVAHLCARRQRGKEHLETAQQLSRVHVNCTCRIIPYNLHHTKPGPSFLLGWLAAWCDSCLSPGARCLETPHGVGLKADLANTNPTRMSIS